MAGFKLCLEGERIYSLQKLVSKLRHLGYRAHEHRALGYTALAAATKDDMIRICREIQDTARAMEGALTWER